MKPISDTVLRLVILLVGLCVVGTATTPVQAADALPESPGWYRTQIGRFKLTALWDGTLEMPVDKVFARPGPAQLKALLARDHLSPTVPLSVNAFVIDTGRHIVMIDTGTGTSRMFGDQLGKLQANLRAAGYAPERIDEIYLTHMHTDHIGGLTVELVPGVRAEPTAGHTPGHTVYVVESEGEKLVLWGDLMHVAAVQFPLPAATVSFDFAPAQSAASRARIYRDSAREGAWIAAPHIGFPGIGKLRADKGGGYSWLPISMLRGR